HDASDQIGWRDVGREGNGTYLWRTWTADCSYLPGYRTGVIDGNQAGAAGHWRKSSGCYGPDLCHPDGDCGANHVRADGICYRRHQRADLQPDCGLGWRNRDGTGNRSDSAGAADTTNDATAATGPVGLSVLESQVCLA